MGTVVSFDVRPGPGDREALFLALASARAGLHRADAVFSTWKPQSPVSRLRRGELEPADAPPEVAEVLARCELARDLTGGWFDPWAMPGGVDPTGLVKGWAAERARVTLCAAGAAAAMVSAGGDASVSGRPDGRRPWRIGIQSPWDRGAIVAVAEVTSAIATSGTYERGGHVFDPHTGRPAAAVASATVTGPSLDLADAMATAVLVGGEEVLGAVTAAGYEGLVVRPDASVVTTAGFPLARD